MNTRRNHRGKGEWYLSECAEVENSKQSLQGRRPGSTKVTGRRPSQPIGTALWGTVKTHSKSEQNAGSMQTRYFSAPHSVQQSGA